MCRSRTRQPVFVSPLSGAVVSFLFLGGAILLASLPANAQPVRLSVPVYGVTAEVEIRDIRREQAEVLARAALTQIFELSQVFDTTSQQPGSLGIFNAKAGDGPQTLDPQAYQLLLRGAQFCLWSSGAYGPLGGPLRHFWQDRERHGLEDPQVFSLALAAADCDHLRMAAATTSSAELNSGSQVDGWGLREGLTVDLAMEQLAASGVRNAWIEIGPVTRGMGDGPSGEGWPVSLATLPGTSEPIGRILLVDQALAAARSPEHGASPYVDQRSGRLAEGTVAVFVVTEKAADAQALATTLFVTGMRDGHRRLGSLSPRPAVLWLLGKGGGQPLEATYRWSTVKRFEPR